MPSRRDNLIKQFAGRMQRERPRATIAMPPGARRGRRSAAGRAAQEMAQRQQSNQRSKRY